MWTDRARTVCATIYLVLSEIAVCASFIVTKNSFFSFFLSFLPFFLFLPMNFRLMFPVGGQEEDILGGRPHRPVAPRVSPTMNFSD